MHLGLAAPVHGFIRSPALEMARPSLIHFAVAGAIAAALSATVAFRGTPVLVLRTADTARFLPAGALQSSVPVRDIRTPLRIVHIGDLNFARGAARQFVLAGRGSEVLAGLTEVLVGADLAIGNLESVLIDRGDFTDPSGTLIFAGPEQSAVLLANAGIDVVATANNHAWDFGRDGMLESLGHLATAGIATVGTGATGDDAWRPAILRAKGWTVAVFSVTRVFNASGLRIDGHPAECCVAWADTLTLREAVMSASDSLGVDIAIVSLHHGTEYAGVPSAAERAFTHAVARTGVDAVIGHHPHVPQGVEYVDGVPVAHSLGNAVFLQNSPWTRVGLMAELVFSETRGPSLTLRPFAATFTPRWLSGADSVAAVRYLDSVSAALATVPPL